MTNPNYQRMPDGKVRKYTAVGGYPIAYLTRDNEVLSAKGIEEIGEACDDPDDGEYVVEAFVNWESEDLRCSYTEEPIECAYPMDLEHAQELGLA